MVQQNYITNYCQGHVTPWWSDDFKNLDYTYYQLANIEDIKRWESDYGNRLTYNGGVYNMTNVMPDYAQPFFKLMPWKNVGISFFRLLTCEALPLHSDHYSKYCDILEIDDPKKIWRCIVFLDDWKSGHYMEVGGQAIVNWRRGDFVYWNNDTPHYAGNFGTEARYTMQITGTVDV
jgi:hypothetical protein